MRGIGFHGRGLSGAAWAGASSHGVYDRPVRCRLPFWSGVSRRPPGRDQRGPDTSGAGTWGSPSGRSAGPPGAAPPSPPGAV